MKKYLKWFFLGLLIFAAALCTFLISAFLQQRIWCGGPLDKGKGIMYCFTAPERNLRGSFVPSEDKKTYLIVLDNNSGNCEPLMVDGKEWTLNTTEKSEIAPGEHRIQCGEGDSGIGFIIPEATVYSFDYWGP